MRIALLVLLAACGSDKKNQALPDGPPAPDGSTASDGGILSDAQGTPDDATGLDALILDAPGTPDAQVFPDAQVIIDAMPMPDAMVDAMPDAMVMVDAMPTGPITGGPCMSGEPGQAAFRVRWAGSGSGSTAYTVYEARGLPDLSRGRAGAYGYQIGYTPRFEDVFLAQGGLVVNSSNFVDIELSTVGLANIQNATLSIYGRSYNTTASGSFSWQSFDGAGAAPTNLVSNAAPYRWYSANMTAAISAGDDGVLLRIKAGPSSGSLVVNRIEICMTAN